MFNLIFHMISSCIHIIVTRYPGTPIWRFLHFHGKLQNSSGLRDESFYLKIFSWMIASVLMRGHLDTSRFDYGARSLGAPCWKDAIQSQEMLKCGGQSLSSLYYTLTHLRLGTVYRYRAY